MIPITDRLLLALALLYAVMDGLLPALGVSQTIVLAEYRWSYGNAGSLFSVVLVRATQCAGAHS